MRDFSSPQGEAAEILHNTITAPQSPNSTSFISTINLCLAPLHHYVL